MVGSVDAHRLGKAEAAGLMTLKIGNRPTNQGANFLGSVVWKEKGLGVLEVGEAGSRAGKDVVGVFSAEELSGPGGDAAEGYRHFLICAFALAIGLDVIQNPSSAPLSHGGNHKMLTS